MDATQTDQKLKPERQGHVLLPRRSRVGDLAPDERITELIRGPIAQAAVGPLHIVRATPRLEDYRRLAPVRKEFQVQALVPQPSIKALTEGILPGAARVDV
jgi:hypothetical protein